MLWFFRKLFETSSTRLFKGNWSVWRSCVEPCRGSATIWARNLEPSRAQQRILKRRRRGLQTPSQSRLTASRQTKRWMERWREKWSIWFLKWRGWSSTCSLRKRAESILMTTEPGPLRDNSFLWIYIFLSNSWQLKLQISLVWKRHSTSVIGFVMSTFYSLFLPRVRFS